MKRKWFSLTVLVVSWVLLLQVGCQDANRTTGEPKPKLTASKPAIGPAKAETASQPNEPAAAIRFEKVVHNFGKIGQGTKNLCEFKFTNAGDGLLKITKVSKTCGCTPFTLEKKEYAPGESGTLKVSYHSGKHPGVIKKRLYVYSNDKARPKVALTVTAEIVTKVNYEPKRLNLSLKQENAGCGEITLSSLDNQPFAIKRFKSTGNSITADYSSSVKKTKFVIQPKVDIEKLRKALSGRIDIRLTHPECDTVTISFDTLPEFTASPPAIIVFNAEPQEPIIKELWILNNYDEDFEIESASSKKDIIKVLRQEKVGNRYKFVLQITPPAAEDKMKIFKDEFFVNIKAGEKLKIICRGFYSKK